MNARQKIQPKALSTSSSAQLYRGLRQHRTPGFAGKTSCLPDQSAEIVSQNGRTLPLTYDFGKVRINNSPSEGIQTKLKLGQPGDKYEQEADRVEDQVMRMPEPKTSQKALVNGEVRAIRIQRMCPACEEEMRRHPEEEEEEEEQLLQTRPLVSQSTPLIQRQVKLEEDEEEVRDEIEEVGISVQSNLMRNINVHSQLDEPEDEGTEEEVEEEPFQGKTLSARAPETINYDLHTQINALRGSGGKPLPESLRAFFEPRFGHDFSQVRIYADARAGEIAQAINAKAFTVNQSVIFGAGQFVPGAAASKRLIAHELTHVLQQRPAKSSNSVPGARLKGRRFRITPKSVTKRTVPSTLGAIAKANDKNRDSLEVDRLSDHGIGIQRMLPIPVKNDPTAREAKKKIAQAKRLLKQLEPSSQKILKSRIARAEKALARYRRTIDARSMTMSPTLATTVSTDPYSGLATVLIAGVLALITALIGRQSQRNPANRKASKDLLRALLLLTLAAEAARRQQKLRKRPQKKKPQKRKRVGPSPAPYPEPKELPKEEPKEPAERRKRRKECRVDWIGPLGAKKGELSLDHMFCQFVTSSPMETEPRITHIPTGDIAWYDAMIGDTVYECKCGYLSTVRAYKRWQKTRSRRLAWAKSAIEGPEGLDQQMARNRRVAGKCKLKLRYYVSNKEVEEFLNARWSHDPVAICTRWSECD
jgi:hypothetical protein